MHYGVTLANIPKYLQTVDSALVVSTPFSYPNLKEEIEPQLPPTAAVISIHQNS